MSFDIRAQLYDRLQWLSMRYYDRHPTGAIISRLTQDTGGVQDFLAFGLPFLITNILQMIGVTVMTLCMNWRLALIALVPIPLISLLTRDAVDADATRLPRVVVPLGTLLCAGQRRAEPRAHHQGLLPADEGDRPLREPEPRGDEGGHVRGPDVGRDLPGGDLAARVGHLRGLVLRRLAGGRRTRT